MSEVDLDEVTRQLEKTSVTNTGVSFEGKSLKLNSEEDAGQVVEAIKVCQDLHYLNLEGNSLGVDAARAIAKTLEVHGELKRALWKDMFTGRVKTEIPKALQYLAGGLMLAGATLTELDLSDNAFGPIGVEGLVVLLQSSTCYSLEILKLNNNGLGTSGGQMLARGLSDCYDRSRVQGKPLALKVFIAGRNRLENDGAKALAQVFEKVGTLEELHMPQNGIYHVGISALSDALKCNKNLRVLNLNDNTITPKGVAALAIALPVLQELRELDLGDCLLKTKGAVNLAEALTDGHKHLQRLLLECNEIGAEGALSLAKAMRNKHQLKYLMLDGNQFGQQGQLELKSELQKAGRLSALGTLDEDDDDAAEDEEGEDDDDEGVEDDDLEEEEDINASDSEGKGQNGDNYVRSNMGNFNEHMTTTKTTPSNVSDFIENPTPEHLLNLGSDRAQRILRQVSGCSDGFLETLLPILMNVSSLSVCSSEEACQAAFDCSTALYEALFLWAKEHDKFSIVNNTLLVYLGLIKSEDKGLKLTWNLDGCMLALEKAMMQDFFPKDTQDIVHVFCGRRVIDVEEGKIIPVS